MDHFRVSIFKKGEFKGAMPCDSLQFYVQQASNKTEGNWYYVLEAVVAGEPIPSSTFTSREYIDFGVSKVQ
jgi:hypothetical protein